MTRNIDTIKSKVQKLLNQAKDQEGKPEGTVFMEKAFELMARYGFDERDLDSPTADDEVTYKEFTFTNPYSDMKMQLLNALAKGLHCQMYATRKRNSTKITQATVFGVRRHLERVEILYSLLNPQMIALAMDSDVTDFFSGSSTVTRRRSFMQGFSTRIYQRLREAENKVGEESNRYAVALRDDAQRAEDLMNEMLTRDGHKVTTETSRRRIDRAAYGQGDSAAQSTDIGQTRVANRAALPA